MVVEGEGRTSVLSMVAAWRTAQRERSAWFPWISTMWVVSLIGAFPIMTRQESRPGIYAGAEPPSAFPGAGAKIFAA